VLHLADDADEGRRVGKNSTQAILEVDGGVVGLLALGDPAVTELAEPFMFDR
jgi:hypothetical protein